MADLLRPDDTRDGLRKLGGLLFGIGVLMLLLRKGDAWADGVVLIVLAIPAVLLYGGGVFTTDATGSVRPWQAVFSVFGLIFVAAALAQFVTTVDDTPDVALNVVWISLVVAALAFYAGAIRGIRFHLLVGSILLIVAWTALWQKVWFDAESDPPDLGILSHWGTYRGLLGLLSIGLLAGAIYLWRTAPQTEVEGTGTVSAGDKRLWKASELLTGAGIAAVIATGLGIITFGALDNIEALLGGDTTGIVQTSLLWDVLLLLVSLGLVALGTQIGTRGPVYVGALGLLFFVIIVGGDLDSLEFEGGEISETPDPTNLGVWPIVLIVLGGLGILLSGIKESSLGDKPRQFINKIKNR